MNPRSRPLVTFLKLFSPSVRRSLALGMVVAVLLAVLDFIALLLLYPVFFTLAAGPEAELTLPLDLPGLEGASPELLVGLAMGCLLLRSVGGFAYRHWWTRKVADAEVALSSRLLHAYAFAPYEFHLRNNSADMLAKAVAHVNMTANSGLNGVVQLATDFTSVLALGSALFIANPMAAAAVFAYLALAGSGFAFLSRRFTARQSDVYGKRVAEVYAQATTVLRGIRELTVAGARGRALGLIDLARSEMTKAQRNMLVLTDVPRLVLELALYVAIMVALLAVLASTEPDSALPVVALYVIAGLRILPAIARGLASLTQMRTGVQMGGQVSAELARVEDAESSICSLAPSIPARGALHLSGVTYRYDNGPPVLHELDLTVEHGEYVAVVGRSGAGKSTLLAIVLGLLNPNSGTVEYAGTSVSGVGSDWLEHVAYLPQDVFILDDSVATNVALGYEQVDEAAVWDALDDAAVADYIRGMPGQLGARLGENGARLSLGQRQRLGLARALYRRPSVLVLDEPTASLDAGTEAAVMATIDALKGTVSILAVSHRLSILGGADAVLSLSEGRLDLVDLDNLLRDQTA